MPVENIDETLVARIRSNYERVQDQIATAAGRAGRSNEKVRLVVVTKSQPLDVVKAVIISGAMLLGESYVEEAAEKVSLLGGSGVEWHMIGHLQSRKAQAAVKLFTMIHSVDSSKLAVRLDRFCKEIKREISILVEFNVSGEASKSGLQAWDESRWDALLPEIEGIISQPNIKVLGLMTMPPWFPDPEMTRPYFKRLHRLQGFLANRFPQASWSELSMGTSIDFTTAVEEGATIVRVGEAIVGPRRKAE